ncbi:isotocin receptor-like [Saccostrea cucullata]|uniref:isotocin receptor-like n=1 Tax=Saccostrea cuccullata TaxID=36930 RepID=UPI002ED68362
MAMAVGVPMFIENLLAILVLLNCKTMTVQIRTLLLNLSVADCLTGLVLAIPDFAYQLTFHCRIKKYMGATITFASILTVSLLNLDRCLALFFGIRYYVKVTDVKVKISCALLWILAFLNSYFMYLDLSLSSGIYCLKVYSSPSNFATKFAKINCLIFVFFNVLLLGYLLYKIPRKATNTVLAKMAIITGTALVCYTPGLFLHAFFPIEDDYYRKLIGYTGVLAFSNSILNPILYVWRFKEAQYVVTKVVCFWNNAFLEKRREDWKQRTATFQINIVNGDHIEINSAL